MQPNHTSPTVPFSSTTPITIEEKNLQHSHSDRGIPASTHHHQHDEPEDDHLKSKKWKDKIKASGSKIFFFFLISV